MPARKGLQTIKDEAKEAMRLELLDIASELLEKEGCDLRFRYVK